MNNNLLLFLIRIFHISIILFVLLGAFSNSFQILILHNTFCFCLLTHWLSNQDICSLTLLESKLRNIDYKNGFIHQFISPMYNISNEQISNLCYIITLIVLSISLIKILKSKQLIILLNKEKRSKYNTWFKIFKLFNDNI